MFFFKQKTAYEMRISDWSSDVCSSDLDLEEGGPENDFSRIGRSRAVILDFTDQVLADAVGRAKAVGEPIGSQDRIVCPRTIGLGEPAEIHGEPFGAKFPIDRKSVE